MPTRSLKLLLLLLFLPCVSWAAPAITVSATGVSILGTNTTISISVTLIDPNSTGNLRVVGTGVIPIMQASTVTPGTTATVGPIYGNDVIADGFGNINSTYYKVQVFTVTNGIVASTPSLQNFYAFIGSGTVDLATATPLSPSYMTGMAGSVVVPGSLTANTINGALYVGGNIATWGAGDIGSQIMAAYAALPAWGGTINVLPQAAGGCYTWTTAINFTTLGKYVKLVGIAPPSFAGTGGGNGEQGLCFNWTSTSGTAMTIDWTNTNGAGNTPGGGIENIMFWNNSCSTNGGCASGATGLSIGPVKGGAMSASFRNVKWRGWGTAWLFNANSAQLNFTLYVENFSFQQNTIAVNSAQASEGWRFTTGVFLQNANAWTQTAGPGGMQVEFDDVHWDGQTTSGISGNCSGNWTFVGNHFENLGTTTTHYVACGNTGTFMFQGGFAGDDNASSTTDYWFTANTVLGNLSIFSAGETATTVFSLGNRSPGMTIANGSPTPLATLGVNQLTQTIGTGTSGLQTGSISSNSCASVVSVSVAGVLTTDVVDWSFATDPNSVSGYGAGATGALSVWAFPTSGHVNFRQCNLNAGSVTAGAISINYTVTR